MYCPNCGTELPAGGRFCPVCGAAQTANSAPVQTATVTLQKRTLLLIVVAAVAVVLLLVVLLLRSGRNNASAADPEQPFQSEQEPEPEPVDPAAALVGTWTGEGGIGLRFTADGTVKLSGFGLNLGGDTFSYAVTEENTLTLSATVNSLVSADLECPYGIMGDTLYIEIAGYSFELTKN